MTPRQRLKAQARMSLAEQQANEMSPQEAITEGFSEGFELDMFDKFRKGLLIGLNQEGQMQSAAEGMDVDLLDEAVQNGIKATQLLKLGGEFALTEVLTGGLGGPILAAMKGSRRLASLVNKAAKAEKLVEKGSGASKIATAIKDFGQGAGIAAGANVGTNVGAAGLAALSGQDTFADNLGETTGEAVGQGLIGGTLNAALQPAIRAGTQFLGAKQVARDVAEDLGVQAEKLTAQSDLAEQGVINTIEKVYAARAAEMKPIKDAINSVEDVFTNSNKKVNISDLPESVKGFLQDLKAGERFDIAGSSEGSSLLKVVKNKNLGEATKDTITEAQLLRLQKNIDGIKKQAAATGDSELNIVSNQIKSRGIDEDILTMFPEVYQNAQQNFKRVFEKYGSGFDKNFKDLNKVYDKLDKGLEISTEEASKALKATNSAQAKKVGSFIDEGVIAPDEVQQAFVGDASKKGKTFFKQTLSGERGQTSKLLNEGFTPSEAAAVEAERLGNVPISTKIRRALGKEKAPNVRTDTSERFVDPLDVASDLTKSESNLTAALGTTPEAAQVTRELNELQFLKQAGPKSARQAVSEAGQAQRAIPGIENLSPAGLANPQAVQTSVARDQILNQLGPQALRSLLQSGIGTTFSNNEFGRAGI